MHNPGELFGSPTDLQHLLYYTTHYKTQHVPCCPWRSMHESG